MLPSVQPRAKTTFNGNDQFLQALTAHWRLCEAWRKPRLNCFAETETFLPRQAFVKSLVVRTPGVFRSVRSSHGAHLVDKSLQEHVYMLETLAICCPNARLEDPVESDMPKCSSSHDCSASDPAARAKQLTSQAETDRSSSHDEDTRRS